MPIESARSAILEKFFSSRKEALVSMKSKRVRVASYLAFHSIELAI